MTTTAPGTARTSVEEALFQLEFPKVTARLAGYTQTPYGYALAEQLRPFKEPVAMRLSLQEADEAISLLVDQVLLPVGSGVDLLPELERVRTEGVRMTGEALQNVRLALEAVAGCRTSLVGRSDVPALRRYAEDLVPMPELSEEIRLSIGPRGEVLDTASLALSDLRQQLQKERARVKRQLENLLADDNLQGVFQETLITDRNGRYVLPVRTDHSGRLKGFVHDVSASGQTLYLEPTTVLDGNNRIQTLISDIEHEIDRILARLTTQVRRARVALTENQAILAHLDLRQAVARFARALDATIPELTDQPQLELQDARHPLLVLQQSETDPVVVPIDLLLSDDTQALIISGPNTGGKTVALKTAGLLVLMARAGLPIPCAPGSRLFPFRPVLADIGDEQSLEHSLSTFSGHLAKLKNILAQIAPGGLVVLDELGTGTDPSEGGALALAALDMLRQSGARIIATTHLHVIKGYAQLEAGVENVAVEFDEETLQPTFRLQYGIPGASHAFTIARRLGLPKNMMQRASDYLGHGEREGTAVIERLQALRIALEDELSSADTLRREAEQERDRRRKLREDLESRRQAILDETRRDGSRLLSQAEARLRELFQGVQPEETGHKERARLTRSVRSLKQSLPETSSSGPETVPTEVACGEILFVPALGVDARVVSPGDRVELEAAGKKLRQPLGNLRQYQPRRFAERAQSQARIRDRVERRGFRPRLILVGKRVDEACAMLDSFLDEAMLHGELSLEIVHGSGQGILRRAVRDLLALRQEVSGFRAADVSEGGENITLVELRH